MFRLAVPLCARSLRPLGAKSEVTLDKLRLTAFYHGNFFLLSELRYIDVPRKLLLVVELYEQESNAEGA